MKPCPACGLLNAEEANFCSGCGFRLSEVKPPGTQYPVPYVTEAAYPRYAGFWIRFAAVLIDGLVLSAIFLPVNLIFWAVNENIYFWGTWDFNRGVGFGLLFLYNLIRTLIGWAYYTYLTGRYGTTLGKKLLGLRVVGEDLQPVTYGTAAVREIPGKFVSALICMFGYIWAGFDGRKQAWHDKIARTFVIYG